MRKAVLFLITIWLLALCAFSQNIRIDGVAQGRSGMPAPGASVAVCSQPANISVTPCTPLVHLCSSLTDTACTQPNPVTADGLGNYNFYLPSIVGNKYVLQFYGSGVKTKTVPDQQYAPVGNGFVQEILIYPNSTNGTVCNQMAKIDPTAGGGTLGNAVTTSGSETPPNLLGVVTSGCGTSGNATIVTGGLVQTTFDAVGVTVGHAFGNSSTAGLVTDLGSANPSSGSPIGQIVLFPNGALPSGCAVSPGCWVNLQMGAGGGGGGGGGGCSGVCVLLTPVGSQTVTQPPGTNFGVTVSGGGAVNINGGTLNIAAGGSLNAYQMPDSGTSCQSLGTSNRGMFCWGTPGSNLLPPGPGNQPIATFNAGGVSYATAIEALANKDQNSGYPSLTSVGQVPLSELIAAGGLGSCTNGTFPQVNGGVLSGCTASSANPAFSSIQTGTNTAANMEVGAGGCLRPAGGACTSGSINANLVNGAARAAASASVNAVEIVTAISGGFAPTAWAFTNAIPNCTTAGGCALGFNSSTHNWTSNNVAGNAAKPMFLIPCTGTNGACPDPSPTITGNATDEVFETTKILAGTLGADGQCVEILQKWKKNSGTTTPTTYKWWLGKDVQTQGSTIVTTNTTQVASTNCSNHGNCENSPILWHLSVCRINGALTTDAYTDQLQASGGTFSSNFNTSIAIDWTADQYITETVNMPASDGTNPNQLTNWGGKVWFP